MTRIRRRFSAVFSNLGNAVLLVWRSSRLWTIASFVLVVLQGLLPVAVLYFTGRMIDEITRVIGSGRGVEVSQIVGYIVLVAVLTFISAALGTAASIIREGHAMAVSELVMRSIHAKSIALDLEFYEDSHGYDRLHRAQRDAPFLPQQIVDNLISVARDGFLIVGVIGLLVSLNALTPVVLFASSIPVLLTKLYFSRRMYHWQQQTAQMERRSAYYANMLTNYHYAKEIRLFQSGSEFVRRYTRARETLRKGRMALVRRRSLFELLTQSLTIAALFIAFAFVTFDALNAVITIGQLVIAFQAFQRGQSAFQSFMSSLATLYESNLFLRNYFDFLALDSQVRSPQKPVPLPPLKDEIRFEGVGFHYRSSNHEVLESVDLSIKSGEVIALVGANGAGKTTLIKLLCRLYDPTKGRITIDGIDIRDVDLDELRRMITVIFQDFNVYQLLAWENIAVANIEKGWDMEEIKKAAQMSGAADFIEQLPLGYQTQLGNWFDDGRELSGGQWQKIALARAFLREARLIILDEPTSSLDVMTEHDIFERFKLITAGRSAIIVSHRLSTVRQADRIFVLDEGRIIEGGTHEELMALNGHYAKLFLTQSQHYVI